MRLKLRSSLIALVLMASFGFLTVPMAHALIGGGGPIPTSPASSDSAAAGEATSQKPEAADTNDQFRHAPKVEAIARFFNISTETAAQIFEDLNSGILIFAILFFVFKLLPKALRGRTAKIQKQLVEARSATEVANERLSAVEAKLARLGEDIEAIRQQTERDILEDEKRIKLSLQEEQQRIIQSVEREIESAGAAAQRDLKKFAAELAIDQAVRKIQLSAESDKALVERFGKDLAGQFGKGGRN